jgi:hypothetical protein
VEHVNVAAPDEHNLSLRKLAARAFSVHVAANRGDRGDLGQLFEDGGFADIAEVENALHAGQCGRDLRAEQAVGIADDADSHGRFLKARFFAEPIKSAD